METPEQAFVRCCTNGYLTQAQLLYDNGVNPSYSSNKALCKAICSGRHDIIEWLLTTRLDLTFGSDALFLLCCYSDHYLSLAKRIAEECTLNQSSIDEAIMYCGKHDVEYASWIVSVGANINHDDGIAFKLCCHYNQFNTAFWLYKHGADYRIKNDKIFKQACTKNHLNTMQFISGLGSFDHYVEMAAHADCPEGVLACCHDVYRGPICSTLPTERQQQLTELSTYIGWYKHLQI